MPNPTGRPRLPTLSQRTSPTSPPPDSRDCASARRARCRRTRARPPQSCRATRTGCAQLLDDGGVRLRRRRSAYGSAPQVVRTPATSNRSLKPVRYAVQRRQDAPARETRVRLLRLRQCQLTGHGDEVLQLRREARDAIEIQAASAPCSKSLCSAATAPSFHAGASAMSAAVDGQRACVRRLAADFRASVRCTSCPAGADRSGMPATHRSPDRACGSFRAGRAPDRSRAPPAHAQRW